MLTHTPEATAMAVESGRAGGFAVLAPLSARVIDKARLQARVMQAGALTIPMDSSTMKIARVARDPTAAWKLEHRRHGERHVLEQVELVGRGSLRYTVRLVRGPPRTTPQRRAMGALYAFDTTEKAHIGRRSPEWTAVGNTEVECVREMALPAGDQ